MYFHVYSSATQTDDEGQTQTQANMRVRRTSQVQHSI
jgi:hypothetical protein